MKKIFTLMLLLAVCTGVFAQGAVARKVAGLVAQGVSFQPVQVLQASNFVAAGETTKAVDHATLAVLRTDVLATVMTEQRDYIELSVPYDGQMLVTQLYRVNPFAQGFHADSDKGATDYAPGLYYRGILKNQPNSLVSFNFFNGEVSGVISGTGLHNVVVGKIDRAGNTSDYIVYSDANLKIANGFRCQTKDVMQTGKSLDLTQRGVTQRCVTMYLEIDHNLYQQNNSSVTETNNWATGVFNNVQTLYDNDDIMVSLKSTYVWTTDDPYEGESSSDYLYQFNDVRPAFDGDVGQLLGIDPGGLGGVAVTIDGLCTQNNFSYADVNFSYASVPTFSWTIEVVTHEFGHLLGGPHTHACVWNGNNTAIDNCGSDYEGGECVTTPPTIPEDGGTIMSYCHLTNVGINFTFGFGPQPKAAIQNAIAGSGCLSTDCVSTCINAVADVNVSFLAGTLTATWTELGNATSWQAGVTPFNGNNPTWTTVTSPTYSTSGLNPNTFYKLWVRPVCDAGLSAPNDRHVFATDAAWCSNVTITDTGGTTNEYTDNESYVRVMIPNEANKKIKLTFTAFDLEAGYDYLYVYDGNSTSAPDLSNGGFDGTDIPGPFESTAADGSLTLRFYSDGGVTQEGYVADVTCLNTLGTASFEAGIDFTYFPNPTSGKVMITSKTAIDAVSVYSVTGQLLYDGKPSATNTNVDLSNFSTGTYFFKLKFGDREEEF